MALFNEDMMRRARNREHARELWGIGQPFGTEARPALEAKAPSGFALGFKFGSQKQMWTDTSLTLAISKAIVGAYNELGEMTKHCSPKGGERGPGARGGSPPSPRPDAPTLMYQSLIHI